MRDDADPSRFPPVAQVMVMADDYGRDPIARTLVAATPSAIVTGREQSSRGRPRVHLSSVEYIHRVASGTAN